MIEIIKQFHSEHGYYPNHSQLETLTGKCRKTVIKYMQELEAQGVITPAKPKIIHTGNYTLT